MSPESAEMTKYVANALLSTKISFINEMANLCERMGGRHQRRPPRHRPRQPHRLRVPVPRRRLRRQLLSQGRAGPGGDGRRSTASSRDAATPSTRSTSGRRRSWPTKIDAALRRQAAGKTIAVWGLAFKPRTDDIREAPALVLIDWLLAAGRRRCRCTTPRRWTTCAAITATS